MTPHTSQVNAQSSRALLSEGTSYKERGCVLTAPAHIEQHIAEAVGTVRIASRGTTPRSAIGKFRLQRPMEQH